MGEKSVNMESNYHGGGENVDMRSSHLRGDRQCTHGLSVDMKSSTPGHEESVDTECEYGIQLLWGMGKSMDTENVDMDLTTQIKGSVDKAESSYTGGIVGS